MKLHEIYEGYVRFTNIRNVAVKILNIHKKIKSEGRCKQEDYDWLQLKCEDEGLLQTLSRAMRKYTNHNSITYGDGAMLDTAHQLASAIVILKKTKRTLDDAARTKIQQATDEVIHSDEMAEIVKQQAYFDLQNSYAQAESESAERVGVLANLV